MRVVHNKDTKYYLKDNGSLVELKEIREVKDLGVVVTNDLKPSGQCKAAAAKLEQYRDGSTNISRSSARNSF